GRDTGGTARLDTEALRIGGRQAIPALANSPYRDLFAVHLSRLPGVAVQKRDKRNVEPGAVFLDLPLLHDSIHHGRRLTLCGLYRQRIPSWGDANARTLASRVRAGEWRASNDHDDMDRRMAHDFG